MANNIRIANLAARAAADAIVDRIDLDTPPGLIRIYDGAQPTDPDTAVGGQTKLAELVLSNPAFGAATDGGPGGLATASAITDDSSADATGTAAWFRMVTGTTFTAVIDGEVGTSGADINFNTVAFVISATISITSLTMTMPET